MSVKNHRHGALNPKAQFRREVTLEQVHEFDAWSPSRCDCCTARPVSDGAAAVLLCPLDQAQEVHRPPVKILGSGLATAPMALADRERIPPSSTPWPAVGRARLRDGRRRPGRHPASPRCTTASPSPRSAASRRSASSSRGEGGQAARGGLTALGGRIPVNTSGGLKSKGHPVGATGIAQAIEIFEQLRGEAGERQVKGARLGLTQNMGGSGASSVVHIFQGV